MPIYDNPCPPKRACYTSDTLPANIYVDYKKYVINLNTPCDNPWINLTSSIYPETDHIMMRDGYDFTNTKIS